VDQTLAYSVLKDLAVLKPDLVEQEKDIAAMDASRITAPVTLHAMGVSIKPIRQEGIMLGFSILPRLRRHLEIVMLLCMGSKLMLPPQLELKSTLVLNNRP
jgi:hypothetical protein